MYDAVGQKLRKTVKDGTTILLTQDYLGGIEVKNNRLEAIYNEEGRAYNTSNATQVYPYTWRYEYNLKDHLGNTRVVFCDKNKNGIIEDQTEILQETHYYPFGMAFNGSWYADNTASKYKYLYNGKELNEDFGLNLSDYGARWYDASIGRWWNIDPLAENYRKWSAYTYGVDNPIRFIDPDGMSVNDIIVKPKRNDETGHSVNTLGNLQKLTDDKLGYASDGQTVVIIKENEGSKKEGTNLIRDLIKDPKDVVITNDVSLMKNEDGTPIKENQLEKQAITNADNGVKKSNGEGSGSKIAYSSNVKANATLVGGKRENSKPEIVLAHELIHADNNRKGNNQRSQSLPDNKLRNKEEVNTVSRENNIRSEQKLPERSNGKN